MGEAVSGQLRFAAHIHPGLGQIRCVVDRHPFLEEAAHLSALRSALALDGEGSCTDPGPGPRHDYQNQKDVGDPIHHRPAAGQSYAQRD